VRGGDSEETALNGICPYFTMFPLAFPLGILQRRARRGDRVLDPFCGRGTTNYAARLLGLDSMGVDSSPVAAAITAAKLVSPTPAEIVAEARAILGERLPQRVPQAQFWRLAYHRDVLRELCALREAFLDECRTPARAALRGIVLGALHGPKQKTFPSYFSNQCPRTYAPKPGYATRYWRERDFLPESVDIIAVIKRKAERYYGQPSQGRGAVRLADSRRPRALAPGKRSPKFKWVITSPPYYGMRTYLPDQWLRYWFLGGPEVLAYTAAIQIDHRSPDDFATDLQRVWVNAAQVSGKGARLVIRFGGIADRRARPLDILTVSLLGTGWRVTAVRPAGSAKLGKRQADTFLRAKSIPVEEHDVWATKE